METFSIYDHFGTTKFGLVTDMGAKDQL